MGWICTQSEVGVLFHTLRNALSQFLIYSTTGMSSATGRELLSSCTRTTSAMTRDIMIVCFDVDLECADTSSFELLADCRRMLRPSSKVLTLLAGEDSTRCRRLPLLCGCLHITWQPIASTMAWKLESRRRSSFSRGFVSRLSSASASRIFVRHRRTISKRSWTIMLRLAGRDCSDLWTACTGGGCNALLHGRLATLVCVSYAFISMLLVADVK